MYFHNSLIPRGAYFLLPLESKQDTTSGWNFTKCISEVKVNQLKWKICMLKWAHPPLNLKITTYPADGVCSQGIIHKITTRFYKIVVRFIVANVHFIRRIVRLCWMWRRYLKLETWYPATILYNHLEFCKFWWLKFHFIRHLYLRLNLSFFCVLFYARHYNFDMNCTVLTTLSISRVVYYLCKVELAALFMYIFINRSICKTAFKKRRQVIPGRCTNDKHYTISYSQETH